jgi:hypothetical protein
VVYFACLNRDNILNTGNFSKSPWLLSFTGFDHVSELRIRRSGVRITLGAPSRSPHPALEGIFRKRLTQRLHKYCQIHYSAKEQKLQAKANVSGDKHFESARKDLF